MVFLISFKGWGWISSYHIFCYSHKDNNKICCFSHDLLNSIQEKEEELLESFFFHQNARENCCLQFGLKNWNIYMHEWIYPLANWRIDASVMHQLKFTCSMIFCTFGVPNQKSSDFLYWFNFYGYKICPSKIRISTVAKNNFFLYSQVSIKQASSLNNSYYC